MLKFFRKIRQQLLKQGNFRRYFFYAFGEILLVMIGILLALQVNKWNEWRKAKEEEKQMLEQIKGDLELEIKRYDWNTNKSDIELEYLTSVSNGNYAEVDLTQFLIPFNRYYLHEDINSAYLGLKIQAKYPSSRILTLGKRSSGFTNFNMAELMELVNGTKIMY